MAKAAIMKKPYDVETGEIRFVFEDDGEDLVLNLSELSEKMCVNLALHGISQKAGDSGAGASREDDPIGYAREMVGATLDTLRADVWTTRTPGGVRITLLVEACARIRECSVEDMQEFVDGLDDAQRKKLNADAKVKTVVAEIKLERAKKASEGQTSILDSM